MTNTVMNDMTSSDYEIDVDVYARGEDGRGVYKTTFAYQASNSGSEIPTGEWLDTIPTVEQGQYLWFKIEFLFDDETTMTSYSVSYFGIDGLDGIDGQDGEDGDTGATFTPSIDNNGNISWTNDKGLPNPVTVNIKGPQGEAGSVKFYTVQTLPDVNLADLDAFYFTPTPNPTSAKRYDEYAAVITNYSTGERKWEKFGDDLSGYLGKTEAEEIYAPITTTNDLQEQIDNLVIEDIKVKNAVENQTYFLTGVDNISTDQPINLYRTRKDNNATGVTYIKSSGATKGSAYVDDELVTTGLYYNIG